jgi:hypothetical protein
MRPCEAGALVKHSGHGLRNPPYSNPRVHERWISEAVLNVPKGGGSFWF